MKTRVLFMYGGNSVEHEISILTALQAMENIDSSKYEAIPCYVSKQGDFYTGEELFHLENYRDLERLCRGMKPVHIERKRGQPMLLRSGWSLFALPFDVVLPLMHGINGEDGSAAGFCRMMQLPFCESDILSAALGQDKGMQKKVLQQEGFLISAYEELHAGQKKEEWITRLKRLHYPLIVKPAMLGSSIGIKKANDEESCIEAVQRAFAYGERVIVEECVQNLRELNCSILHTPYGYRSSAVEEVSPQGGLYDYDEKYLNGNLKQSGPCSRIWLRDEQLVSEVQHQSLQIAKLLQTKGVIRIDFLYDEGEKKLYVNEMNTIPGSLSYYLWEWEGVGFAQLLDLIIQDGITAYQQRSRCLSSYSTNVLQMTKLYGHKK